MSAQEYFFNVAELSFRGKPFMYYPESGLVDNHISFQDWILHQVGFPKDSAITTYLNEFQIPCIKITCDSKSISISSDEITILQEYNEDSTKILDDTTPIPGQLLLLKMSYDYDFVLFSQLNDYTTYRFMHGLCNLFAEELKRSLEKGEVKAIQVATLSDHAFLLLEDKYIDITGVHSQQEYHNLNGVDGDMTRISNYVPEEFNGQVNYLGMLYTKSIVSEFIKHQLTV